MRFSTGSSTLPAWHRRPTILRNGALWWCATLRRAVKSQTFVGEAPVVLACCAKDNRHVMTCGQASYPIDAAIAIDHITLCAAAEGLGTCWIGAFYEDEVKQILGIPPAIRVVALLPLGYPRDPQPVRKLRLSLERIVSYESWKFD
jgi:nitroreductase